MIKDGESKRNKKIGNPAWVKGVSGNPNGRPPGHFSPVKKAIRDVSMELINKAIKMAREGDKDMIIMLLSKCDLQTKDPVYIDISKTSDEILNDALDQYASGDMADTTMATIDKVVKTRLDALDIRKMNERLDKIEEAKNNDNGENTETPAV